jgi:hypothetical protein
VAATASDDLYRRLSQGPVVLFLGQQYLRLETGSDPFLSAALAKFLECLDGGGRYDDLLSDTAYESVQAALAWMHQRSERLPAPDWLQVVAEFPWSALYTSAIDTVWEKAFRLPWRELDAIFEEKVVPSDPRNRSILHCTCLFGRVDQDSEPKHPPLTRREWLRRRHEAVAMARRIPDVVTPMGVLMIEGYQADDWLRSEDLLPILDSLLPGQVHVFSSRFDGPEDGLLSRLASEGQITLHPDSLAATMERGVQAGVLAIGARPFDDERGRRIRLGRTVAAIPTHVWNQATQSAIVLDEALIEPPGRLSPERRLAEFRRFLSESAVCPIWSGYARGFAFPRGFEEALRRETERRLKSNELQKEPVIVHGQTGTGKTVALGRLSYDIRSDGRYPVLFVERRLRDPAFADIEAFCNWAESRGAPAVLVVWDGMVGPDKYYGLTHYLAGGGRKAVVVGSCYRHSEGGRRRNFIEAPIEFRDESARFDSFLNGLDPGLAEYVARQGTNRDDSTFLVALYRLLPDTRAQILSGVVREIGLAEGEIRRHLGTGDSTEAVSTAVAHALLRAGVIGIEDLVPRGGEGAEHDQCGGVQDLMGLVMVPGRFGIGVPIELLMRTLGRGYTEEVLRALRAQDVFRWREDGTGNILIGPRHSLEARLFAFARLGGPKGETDYCRRLLLEVRTGPYQSDSLEVDFAVDLLHSVGPNGPDARYFASHLRELSGALRELRLERGMRSPRLMLQEASLLREWVVEQARAGSPPPEAEGVLGEAAATLAEADELLGTGRRSNILRSMVTVEMAALAGARARYALDYDPEPKRSTPRARQFYHEARELLRRSRSSDPGNYYPLDVLAWLTRDLVEARVLDETETADAEAELLNAFDMAEEEDFALAQLEQFHTRRMEIGQLFRRHQLTQDAFDKLAAQGSAAGYYLRARAMARGVRTDRELDCGALDRCTAVVTYLRDHWDAVSADARCMYLLLRYWWMQHAGRPLFFRERDAVPFGPAEWRSALEIISAYMLAPNSTGTPYMHYLQGLAAFHVGDIDGAFRTFRDLEREADHIRGRRRIIRSYLAATPDGAPEVFSGTVDWVDEERRRGAIYVPRLRDRVPFLPREFGMADPRRSQTIDRFHIAFNFRGPIADPLSFRSD